MPDWAVILILVAALAMIVTICIIEWPWGAIVLGSLVVLAGLAILITSLLGIDLLGELRLFLIDNAPLFTQFVRQVKSIGRSLFNL